MANPFELIGSTTFDEVLPEPITVSLIEFIEEKTKDGITRRKPKVRVAEINTYVPMKIFHRMMASQEKIRAIQEVRAKAVDGKLDDGSQQTMLLWMVDQVLQVWQLTEPDMTGDKLTEGLSFQKVIGLFGVFFGDLLKEAEVVPE
jgi:hypothetical protein